MCLCKTPCLRRCTETNTWSLMAQLEIRLLGSLQISQDNSPANDFISSKVPALLAYLAVTRRPHTRDKLAALLWG